MKQQVKYFWNGLFWYTQDMVQLNKKEIEAMLKETKEGQYIGLKDKIVLSDSKFESREDIRYKLI